MSGQARRVERLGGPCLENREASKLSPRNPMPKPENPDVAATLAIVVPIIIILIILGLLG